MEGPKPTMQLQFDKPLQIVTPNKQSNTQSIVLAYIGWKGLYEYLD